MHCIESPEVLFVDISEFTVAAVLGKDSEYQFEVDPLFVSACEPGSLKIIGAHADGIASSAYWATLIESEVKIHVHQFMHPKSFSVRITIAGTRKGFAGVRFPQFTEEQAKRNEAFWNQSK